ncbi:Winged helix-turn helix [Streptomyces sp. BvitLS-983]|nr:Winged helix-turn helix [Streptomyces sp. BvitLS-983]
MGGEFFLRAFAFFSFRRARCAACSSGFLLPTWRRSSAGSSPAASFPAAPGVSLGARAAGRPPGSGAEGPRGSSSSVRFRRPMMLLASARGSTVPVIARAVQADEDTVRDLIHKFNEIGLARLNPRWAGGRPRLLDRDDEDFVVQTATTRPTALGKPFTRWSASSLITCAGTSPGPYGSAGRLRGAYCPAAGSPSGARRPGRSPRTPTSTQRSPQSSTRSTSGLTARSRSTSSDRWASAPPPARAGQNKAGQTAGDVPPNPRDHLFPRRLLRRQTTKCEGSTGAARASTTSGRPCEPSGPPARAAPRSTGSATTSPPHTKLAGEEVGGQEQGRAVYYPDLRLLGQPHRAPLRTAAAVHPGQLEPSQPYGPPPGPSRLPALAQPELPPPRRPCSPTT